MASDSSNDEISLEDLVGEVQSTQKTAGAPTGAASGAGPSDSPARDSEANPEAGDDATKVADIDNLLESEDPIFASSMKDLQKQGAKLGADAEIDSLDLEKLAGEKPPGRWKMFFFWLIRRRESGPTGRPSLFGKVVKAPLVVLAALRALASFGKDAALHGLGVARKTLGDFRDLPLKGKLMIFAALGFGALAVMTMKYTLGGKISFGVSQRFLRSFADVADATYTYSESEPIDDFTDPLFHPEHVLLLDKFVVNLRRPQDGSNPMGLFEFYLEASNQDCAVELKNRSGEVRDVISRTIEQMPYSELVTVEGKEKLKIIIRKNINAIVTRGQVRRVFYKTVILKP